MSFFWNNGLVFGVLPLPLAAILFALLVGAAVLGFRFGGWIGLGLALIAVVVVLVAAVIWISSALKGFD